MHGGSPNFIQRGGLVVCCVCVAWAPANCNTLRFQYHTLTPSGVLHAWRNNSSQDYPHAPLSPANYFSLSWSRPFSLVLRIRLPTPVGEVLSFCLHSSSFMIVDFMSTSRRFLCRQFNSRRFQGVSSPPEYVLHSWFIPSDAAMSTNHFDVRRE